MQTSGSFPTGFRVSGFKMQCFMRAWVQSFGFRSRLGARARHVHAAPSPAGQVIGLTEDERTIRIAIYTYILYICMCVWIETVS